MASGAVALAKPANVPMPKPQVALRTDMLSHYELAAVGNDAHLFSDRVPALEFIQQNEGFSRKFIHDRRISLIGQGGVIVDSKRFAVDLRAADHPLVFRIEW